MPRKAPKPKRLPAIAAPAVEKKPFRLAPSPQLSDSQVVWRLQFMDDRGPWPWHTVKGSVLADIRRKLVDFEKMTWGEIQGSKHKLIPCENLDTPAQTRLRDLELDDAEGVWELRLGGLERVWGLRIDNIFYLLWWDPLHKVCPSRRR